MSHPIASTVDPDFYIKAAIEGTLRAFRRPCLPKNDNLALAGEAVRCLEDAEKAALADPLLSRFVLSTDDEVTLALLENQWSEVAKAREVLSEALAQFMVLANGTR